VAEQATSRRFWVQTDKETGKYITAIDLAEIVAINVPQINEPGCTIMLRSGQSITFAQWDGEIRENCIKYILDNVTHKETQ
jgi:hypothetical protein